MIMLSLNCMQVSFELLNHYPLVSARKVGIRKSCFLCTRSPLIRFRVGLKVPDSDLCVRFWVGLKVPGRFMCLVRWAKS